MKRKLQQGLAIAVATALLVAQAPQTVAMAHPGRGSQRLHNLGQLLMAQTDVDPTPAPQPEPTPPPTPEPTPQPQPTPEPTPQPQPTPAPTPQPQPAQVRVTFVLSGGSIGGSTGSHVINVAAGSVPSVPTPTRPGHNFAGWQPQLGAIHTNSSFTATWTPVVTAPVQPATPPVTAPEQPVAPPVTAPVQPATPPVTAPEQPVTPPVTAPEQPVTPPVTTPQQPTPPVAPPVQPATPPVTTPQQPATQPTPSTTHTVTFLTHSGGTVAATFEIANGNMIGVGQVPATPTRTGYNFTGWSPNPLATPVQGPVTFVGQWQAVAQPAQANHTVTLVVEGTNFVAQGNNTMTLQVAHGGIIPWATVRQNLPAGVNLAPWTRNGQSFNENTAITEAVTLTSRLATVTNHVTVTFALAGGTFNNSTANVVRSVPAGQSLRQAGQLFSPTRAGHHLDGQFPWLLNGRSFDSNAPINENITLTANWRANTSTGSHPVTFELNGGSIHGNHSSVVVWVPHGSSIPTSHFPNHNNTLVRSGFTLHHQNPWTDVHGHVFNHGTAIHNALNLRANWVSSNSVTLTFDPNGGHRTGGGSGRFTRSLPAGGTWQSTFPNESFTNWSAVTRPGFHFNGWVFPNGTAFTQNTAVPRNNTTLTATWTPNHNTVQVNFSPRGGSLRNSTNAVVMQLARHHTFTQSTGLSSLQQANLVPTRSGHTFEGWELPNGSLVNLNRTVFTENVTLTPRWNSNTSNLHTLSFDPNGGVWTGNLTNNQNRHIGRGHSVRSYHATSVSGLVPDLNRHGYQFDGWLIGNTNNLFTENTVVNNNMTLRARWVPLPALAPTVASPVPTVVIPSLLPAVVAGAPVTTQTISLSSATGAIFAGAAPVHLDAALGQFHINEQGVSVLPARAILSVLFGADPHDPHLFMWDDQTRTFSIDPTGYNIRITVGSQMMYVRDVPRQILSGSGAAAFPVSAYVNPADGRLYVPVRAIAEAIGFDVGWDPATSLVTLSPPVL